MSGKTWIWIGERVIDKTILHYDQHARRYQSQYDSVAATDVHAEWVGVLERLQPGYALDVGAGSGRDAAWLDRIGWRVTAAEPSPALRELGRQRTGSTVQWCDARLPGLEGLAAPAREYDLILLSAVWMHLKPEHRPRAFARLDGILSRQGVLIITLRFGAPDPDRPMYAVSAQEVERLAHACGRSFHALSEGLTPDRLRRSEVRWQTVCVASEGWNPP